MNHRSNWATMALVWLIGLVGCSDYEGAAQPEQPPPPPIQEPVDEQAARDAAWKEMVAVHKLLQEWDGEYRETWYTDDPRAAQIFPGWQTKPVTLEDGRKVLRAWCDHEQCFAPGYGHPMQDPSFVPEDYEEGHDHGIDFEPKSRPLRLGTARQAECASGIGSLCPGPWIKNIGGVVPDNRTHTYCLWPFLGTVPDYLDQMRAMATAPSEDWLGINLVEDTSVGCAGWSWRNNVELEASDPETAERWFHSIATVDNYRYAPIYADGGIDVNGNSGYHQTRPVTDVFFYNINSQATLNSNCPVPDFTDNPRPILGCATAWFMNPLATTTPCYWQLYQRSCPAQGFCSACPYHRVAAWAVGFQQANINIKADYYGFNRRDYRRHVTCHEFGHTLGLTHTLARFGTEQFMRPRAHGGNLETCMSSVHPGATDHWGSLKWVNLTYSWPAACELRGGYPTKIENGETVCDTSQTLDTSGRRLYGTTDY